MIRRSNPFPFPFALYLLFSMFIHLGILIICPIIKTQNKYTEKEFRVVALMNLKEQIVPHKESQDRQKNKSSEKVVHKNNENKRIVEKLNLSEGFKGKGGADHSEDMVEAEKVTVNTPIPSGERIFLPFYSIDSNPVILSSGVKRYPLQARSQGLEGRVILDVYLDEKGNVVRIEIVQQAGHGFDKAAIEYAESTIWKPGVHQGKPV